MLVAHDLLTGLARGPVWGALPGEHAVSEQALIEKLLVERMPGGAVVVGDISPGVFSVAYAAGQRQHPAVLRMQEQRDWTRIPGWRVYWVWRNEIGEPAECLKLWVRGKRENGC